MESAKNSTSTASTDSSLIQNIIKILTLKDLRSTINNKRGRRFSDKVTSNSEETLNVPNRFQRLYRRYLLSVLNTNSNRNWAEALSQDSDSVKFYSAPQTTRNYMKHLNDERLMISDSDRSFTRRFSFGLESITSFIKNQSRRFGIRSDFKNLIVTDNNSLQSPEVSVNNKAIPIDKFPENDISLWRRISSWAIEEYFRLSRPMQSQGSNSSLYTPMMFISNVSQLMQQSTSNFMDNGNLDPDLMLQSNYSNEVGISEVHVIDSSLQEETQKNILARTFNALFPVSLAALKFLTKKHPSQAIEVVDEGLEKKPIYEVEQDILLEPVLDTTVEEFTRADSSENIEPVPSWFSYIPGLKIATNLISWTKKQSGLFIETDSLDFEQEKRIKSDVLDNEVLSQYDPILQQSAKAALNIPFPFLGVENTETAHTDSSSNILGKSNVIRDELDSKPIDESLNRVMRMGRSQELKSRPLFIEKDAIPLPTRADFNFINQRKIAIAVCAALSVKSLEDVECFIREIGLKPLVAALLTNPPNPIGKNELRTDAAKGICRLIRSDLSLAYNVTIVPGFIPILCDMMEAPLRGFLSFRSQTDREKELKAQYEAISLAKRIVRSNDEAVKYMRNDLRLRKVLSAIVLQGELNSQTPVSNTTYSKAKHEGIGPTGTVGLSPVDLVDIKAHEMARVVAWALGGVAWKPKQPGQKGLRILSFDGGGTRGVLSLALLKELMKRTGKSSPYELFDIICGTSTGGIIAALFGIQRSKVDDAEKLYDSLISRIFGQKSNLKLVTSNAFYDEQEFEKILRDLCGDELLIDSNRFDCSRVFCVSTQVNKYPASIQIWRNYNYAPGQESRYNGAFRVNTMTAIRATTAAPTFFTPVSFEGGLFSDGALVANNPTAIALQEAKVLYPNIPVECVVSIGTGYYSSRSSKVQGNSVMGWDVLVNQLVASSTDTEDVHALLNDFLPNDKYFRLNPVLQDNLAIDEKNMTVLTDLKKLARQTWKEIDNSSEAKRFDLLIKTLRGP